MVVAVAMLPGIGSLSADDSVESQILAVFPESVAQVPAGRRGRTAFSARYTPSGSIWDKRLDEKQVFQMQIAHSQDSDNSFVLRIGKGGQIYSLRGAFGESVPPSWRSGSGRVSPWNDEVWQFVAVCTRYNGLEPLLHAGRLPDEVINRFKSSPYKTSFFIHNSGAYITGHSAVRSLYCPSLASQTIAETRCYRTVNWGLVPQLRTIHRSPLLYYTQVRDVGDGVIELTWVVHNFSVRDDVVFDHLNAPWGGTRVSSLPLRYVSSAEGRLLERDQILDAGGVVNVRKTGGWNISCASDASDSPSLALVFGTDKHLEAQAARRNAGKSYCQFQPSLYRDWRANAPRYKTVWKDWKTRPPNSFRNFDVAEVIPRLRIVPGTTIWYRSFLVVGRRDHAMELARGLVDSVDYGLVQFDPASTPLIPISVQHDKAAGERRSRRPTGTFNVFAHPVSGTTPLFLIRNTQTGRRMITTDPYYFVEKEKVEFGVPANHPDHDYYSHVDGYAMDHNHSHWQSLLGFGYKNRPDDASWKRLSTLLDPSVFPPPTRYHLDLWVRAADAE